MDLNEFFGKMPERPDHPDFWKLSNVCLKLDSGLDPTNPDEGAKERQYQARLDEIDIDGKSLAYVATQRAYRVLGIENHGDLLDPNKMMMVAMLASVWLDAFAHGVLFERKE